MSFMASLAARDTARLEARHGDVDRALQLLDETVASFHRGGELPNVAATIASLTVLFDRLERPAVAATLLGITMDHSRGTVVIDVPTLVARFRSRLGDTTTDAAITAGTHMDLAAGVRYAHEQIAIVQRERAQQS